MKNMSIDENSSDGNPENVGQHSPHSQNPHLDHAQSGDGLLGADGGVQPSSPQVNTTMNEILQGDGAFGNAWKDYLTKTVGQDIANASEVDRFKNPAELAKSYVNLSKAYSKKFPENTVEIPNADSPPEKLEEFYNKIGRPESPDKYKAPEIDNLDKEALGQFNQFAHKLGLTEKQYEEIIKFDAQRMSSVAENYEQQKALSLQEGRQTLRSMFGDEYEFNMAAARRVANEFDVDNVKDLIGNDYRAVAMLAKIGKKLFAEDDIKGDINGVSAVDVKTEINKLRSSDAYFDSRDPNHRSVVSRVRQLSALLN